MYKCPGCGAGLRFDPAAQKLVCDHCMKQIGPEAFDTLENTITASGQDNVIPESVQAGDSYQAIIYTCPNCGGQLISTDETAATFCSYCGASVLLQGRLEEMKAPKTIIPFKVTREDGKKAYKKALASAIFAPSYMKKAETVDQFRGIYMPYWLYSFMYDDTVHARGKVEKRRGDYVYVDRYEVTKPVTAAYEGTAFDAASSFSDNLSQAIAPFDVTESRNFSPAYMSGFYADVSDVYSDVYYREAHDIAKRDLVREVNKDYTFIKYGVSSGKVDEAIGLQGTGEEIGMFPVWFLASRNKKNDRVSYAVVNGQTGRVAADLPIDFGKYVLGSLLLAIPLFLVFSLFLFLTPMRMLLAALVTAVIGMIILNRQLNRAFTRENQLDDKGYLSVEKGMEAARSVQKKTAKKSNINIKGCGTGVWVAVIFGGLMLLGEVADSLGDGWVLGVLFMVVFGVAILIIVLNLIQRAKGRGGELVQKTVVKAPFKEKMLTLAKPFIGIIAGVIVYVLNPAEDWFFYGAAILSMLLTIWSVYDIVQQHNIQTMRKLPQFNRRGGAQNV